MPSIRRGWTREESILAFNLYCKIPFGQIRHGNPAIIELARHLGRTPSSVSMKMGNFARLDPTHQRRNVKGLAHGSRLDKEVWDEFNGNWEELAFESERAIESLSLLPDEIIEKTSRPQPTESLRQVRVRLVQNFFRGAVLSGYHFRCAVCQLNLPALLNASHIIPWAKSHEHRADPRNGISLCALHDRAFDRGLITFDEDYRTVISKRVHQKRPNEMHRVSLLEIEGRKMLLPERFRPDGEALAYHREHVFCD